MSSSTSAVLKDLAEGRTVTHVAELHGWSRPSLLALAIGVGWAFDEETDAVLGPSGDRELDAVTAEFPLGRILANGSNGATPRNGSVALSGVDRLLANARQSDNPQIRRAVAAVDAAAAALRDVYYDDRDRTRRLAAAQAKAERLASRLAETKAEIRKLGNGAAPPPGGPRSHEIRVWAKAHGIKVNERGRVPREVVDQYHEAHSEERSDGG